MSNILVVDDEESICWGIAKLCKELGYECQIAASAEQGMELASKCTFDVVVMDIRLPGMDGLTAIESFRNLLGCSPIIIITAFGDLQTAIDAIQKGAFEYIVKPFELKKVAATINQAIATSRILRRQSEPPSPKPNDVQGGDFVGSSAVMQSVYKQIAITTTTDAPVLLTGESGTGKELAARTIHRFGNRSDRPFLAVNIAALSPTLIESELFGHVQGAFTGADAARKGLIESANGGTLFLDEIAEIPIELQVKLLRVLDQGEVTPVGSNSPTNSEFRLISATNQDLPALVNTGQFRHDLFYRIRSFEIRMPALRDRPGDIEELAQHFVSQEDGDSAHLTRQFIEKLKTRPWFGNVRELENAVGRAVAVARGGVLLPEHLDNLEPVESLENLELDQQIQSLICDWTESNWSLETDLYQRFIESIVERAMLPKAFALSDQQYSAAARKLGIHRTTLKRKLANDA